MNKARSRLQTKLENVADKYGMTVYYQPPSSVLLKYPCITYSSAGYITKRADNGRYFTYQKFEIVYITKDPESTVHLEIFDAVSFPDMGRPFTNDNLYHQVITCAEHI